MAPKKAKVTEDAMDLGDNSAELDQAIDDLRGVLKADSEGTADIGAFSSDFDSSAETPSFGGDFDTPTDSSADLAGSSDFGTGFGGDTFGDTAFGDTGFSGTSFGGAAEAHGTTGEPGSGMQSNMDLIMDIPIDVQIILGASRMQVSSLMNLNEGAIISLDRRIGEPVDLVVNGRLIGRGEITVLENDETRFGVRLLEVKPAVKS